MCGVRVKALVDCCVGLSCAVRCAQAIKRAPELAAESGDKPPPPVTNLDRRGAAGAAAGEAASRFATAVEHASPTEAAEMAAEATRKAALAEGATAAEAQEMAERSLLPVCLSACMHGGRAAGSQRRCSSHNRRPMR